MKPKLISLGFAVPEAAMTQRQVFDALQYPRHFWPVFRDAGIEKRHFWVPLGGPETENWQLMCEKSLEGAKELAKRAISNCMDGYTLQDIGCISWVSCCGYYCPSPLHHIAQEIGIPKDTVFTNIQGMGCEGLGPGGRRAYDYALATGRPALSVAVEVCSSAYFPEPPGKPDPTNDWELLRGNAIFADAAAAVLIGYDDDPHHPYILDNAFHTEPAYLNDLGFTWQNGRLRLLLSKKVPQLAPQVAMPAIRQVFERNSLSVKDIDHWVIHAGGAKILDNVRDALELSEEKIVWSRRALSLYGNTSSTSIGIIGKLFIENADIKPGDYCAVVSLGPGLSGGCTLLRFPEV